MDSPSRRDAIGGVAGAAALAGFGGGAAAQAAKVRYSATSARGRAMLRIYVDAVSAMMAKDPRDPLSWTFQWYVHAIPMNKTKAQELAALFPTPSATQTLAMDTWSTCEPHFSGASDNFLPWHRMYVARFEAIIRKVSNRDDFNLPYWDYTQPGAARALPPEFRRKDDPIWGPLYRANRRSTSNSGQGIDTWPNAYAINLESMRSVRYSDDGADAGFCANLDGGLHGNIHGDVGNGQGMGSVPWAAGDPVFWIHHCNIDRIWASWNQAGGKNLTDAAFLAQKFDFADANGAQVEMQVADVMTLAQAGYTYDSYLPLPAGSPPFPTAGAFTVTKHAETKAASGPVVLGGGPSTVTLNSANPAGFAPNAGFSVQMRALPSARTVYLRLVGLESNAEVTGGYDVYLNLPQGQTPSRSSPAFVGTVNFFGTGLHHDHAAAMTAPGAAPRGRTVSFRVTTTVRRAGFDAREPQITFVPVGEVDAAAMPRVSRVEIVSQ